MQRRCTITTATLAGVSANITQPSIHPVYAKCANDGYLLLDALRPWSALKNHHPAATEPRLGFPSAPLCPLRPRRRATHVIVCSYPPLHGGSYTITTGKPDRPGAWRLSGRRLPEPDAAVTTGSREHGLGPPHRIVDRYRLDKTVPIQNYARPFQAMLTRTSSNCGTRFQANCCRGSRSVRLPEMIVCSYPPPHGG